MDEITKTKLVEAFELNRSVGIRTIRCVRVQPAKRDVAQLLDPAMWESRPWNGDGYGIRNGVSACWDLDQLAWYLIGREADLDDCVVVEMEAYKADEEDEDAYTGYCVLTWPTRVISVTSVEESGLLEAMREEEDYRYGTGEWARDAA